MTPKEKAKELVHKFSIYETFHDTGKTHLIQSGVSSALIAVEEIIQYTKVRDTRCDFYYTSGYWQEVKQEIEKL